MIAFQGVRTKFLYQYVCVSDNKVNKNPTIGQNNVDNFERQKLLDFTFWGNVALSDSSCLFHYRGTVIPVVQEAMPPSFQPFRLLLAIVSRCPKYRSYYRTQTYKEWSYLPLLQLRLLYGSSSAASCNLGISNRDFGLYQA